MGLDIGIESDIIYAEDPFPDLIRLNKKHLRRSCYGIMEQYLLYEENSVLGQLNALLSFNIDFLSKIFPSFGELDISEEYWIAIDSAKENITKLIAALSKSKELIKKNRIPNEKLRKKCEFYISYILAGEFSSDLYDMLYIIDKHDKAGAKRIFFYML